MGKLIISETEKRDILSLYEQTDNQYKKENDFLKRYIGKTFNTYDDINQHYIHTEQIKIENIKYGGSSILINDTDNWTDRASNFHQIKCSYNPNKLDINGFWSYSKKVFSNDLVNNINSVGNQNGIQWCKKPKADFGLKNVNESTNTV